MPAKPLFRLLLGGLLGLLLTLLAVQAGGSNSFTLLRLTLCHQCVLGE